MVKRSYSKVRAGVGYYLTLPYPTWGKSGKGIRTPALDAEVNRSDDQWKIEDRSPLSYRESISRISFHY